MLLLTFFVAVVVNFVGYIPLGNINLTAMQISINKGLKQVLVFATSFALVEGVFTYVLMRFAEWFASKESFMVVLEWAMVAIFLLMGFLSLRHSKKERKPKEVLKKRDSIRTGIILGVFNPMIIPFWTIGGTYLIAHDWITTEGFGLEVFAVGASVGSFSCLYLFGRFAQYIQNKFAFSNRVINKSIALMFFGLAVLQTLRLTVF
ncbi:lysine transporter LysE [Pelobium manganitolerans]|uniref:Lysine transporter LysE n=1 Tax=Pelobium manganitolerans TaxID=1842495 RepID=A0A419S2H5_9SPHI|nr:LysE family transporter [Pelobium manganitolerans]RKD13182.1 lysine transporter LysE [Pelobium manganitolerans]